MTAYRQGHLSPLAKAYDDSLKEVGRMMKPYLKDDLLPKMFAPLPKVEAGVIKECRKEPDFKTGRPECEKILPWGLTPLTVLNAVQAIEGLLWRADQRGILPADEGIQLGNLAAVSISKGNKVSFQMIAEAVEQFAHVDISFAAALVIWVLERGYPLFRGFKATPEPDGSLRLEKVLE